MITSAETAAIGAAHPAAGTTGLPAARDAARPRLAGPPATAIPRFPASWYRFGGSGELDRGPVGRSLVGRYLVAFRGRGGRAAVIDGRCVHQGADLGRGEVVGDCLRCPFHAWEFDAAGTCRRIPTTESIPAFARQRAYATAERHGSLYFWLGASAEASPASGELPEPPSFPLPFAEGEEPADFDAAAPFRLAYEAPWYAVFGNAFDVAHFGVVHDRRLLGPPVIDEPSPWCRRIAYRVEVVGGEASDRFLRRFAGDTVEVEHRLWGGTILFTRARFPRAESLILFAMRPVDAARCVLEPIVFRRRGSGPLDRVARAASLWLRRRLTIAFMGHEVAKLGSIGYSPSTCIDADRPMVELMHWLAALPRA